MRFIISYFKCPALHSLDFTIEFSAFSLAPAICAFDIALSTAHSVKFRGFGLHVRRRADLSPAAPVRARPLLFPLFSLSSRIEYMYCTASSLRIIAPRLASSRTRQPWPNFPLSVFVCVLVRQPQPTSRFLVSTLLHSFDLLARSAKTTVPSPTSSPRDPYDSRSHRLFRLPWLALALVRTSHIPLRALEFFGNATLYYHPPSFIPTHCVD